MQSLSHRHEKYLKSNHDFSEVHANCHLHNTQKGTFLLTTPGRPAEICAQKQCLHFFTILLTAICDRG